MRRMMNIGRLSKRIKLYKLAESTDSMGQSTQKLSEVGEIWADIYPVRGTEFYELKKIQSKVTHKCFIRWHESYSDIDSNWFIKCRGEIFDIDSAVNVDLEDKMIEIRCYKRVNKEGHEIETPVPTPEEPTDPQEELPSDPPEEEEDNG